MNDLFITATIGNVYVDGRPVAPYLLRAMRELWASGDARAVYTAVRQHRARMRRLHGAYRAKWRRP